MTNPFRLVLGVLIIVGGIIFSIELLPRIINPKSYNEIIFFDGLIVRNQCYKQKNSSPDCYIWIVDGKSERKIGVRINQNEFNKEKFDQTISNTTLLRIGVSKEEFQSKEIKDVTYYEPFTISVDETNFLTIVTKQENDTSKKYLNICFLLCLFIVGGLLIFSFFKGI